MSEMFLGDGWSGADQYPGGLWCAHRLDLRGRPHMPYRAVPSLRGGLRIVGIGHDADRNQCTGWLAKRIHKVGMDIALVVQRFPAACYWRPKSRQLAADGVFTVPLSRIVVKIAIADYAATAGRNASSYRSNAGWLIRSRKIHALKKSPPFPGKRANTTVRTGADAIDPHAHGGIADYLALRHGGIPCV